MALPDPNIKCPYSGFDPEKGTFRASCRSIVAACDCPKYVKVVGTNPNTGEPIDKEGCIDSVMHLLMIENSQMQRSTAAAVESFRNEVVERAEKRMKQAAISNVVQRLSQSKH